MSATLNDKPKITGVDAQGNPVDLSDFEESYYKPGEVEATIEDYFESFESITEGQIIKGKILKITDKEVFIDVNFKSEGVIPVHEFKSISEYKTGDEIEVFLEQIEDSEGNINLSKSRADFLKVWDKIYEAYENEEIVEGRLLRRIKGGVVVDLFGVDAFLPGSQIDLRQIPDMDAIIGETFEFRVIKINKIRRNIVVSRRVILEADRMEQRDKILSELKKSEVREGSVKNITDFGAFIDLGGVDGLLHITDMSWGRVNHPSEIVALGDTLNVMILDFDDNKERISLGLKQLTEHPWKDVIEKFPEGSRVRGKVVSITDYGAFMELEKGIEGLIHISEMSWTQHIKHPSKLVGIGDIVEAVVLKVDKDNHKISLGFKQLEPDPWENVYNDYPIGSVSTGKVRNIAAFGAFVELQEGVDGLVHISDMSWTKKINYPGEIIKKGDSVEVKILNIDEEKRRISLGIKQLTDDPWSNLAEQFPVGKEIECEVARILDRGIVVNLTNDVEGFIPLKELGQPVKHPSDVYVIGDKNPAKVIEFDIDGRKIVVSVSEYFKGRPEEELKEYLAAHPVKKSAAKKSIKKDKNDTLKEEAENTPVETGDEAVDTPEDAEKAPVETVEAVDTPEASENAGEPAKVETEVATEENTQKTETDAVVESTESSESVEETDTVEASENVETEKEPEVIEPTEKAEAPESLTEEVPAVENESDKEPEVAVSTETEKDAETVTEAEAIETPENTESTEPVDSADDEKKE